MKNKTMFIPDKNGNYETYGGAYIPELLYPNVEELKKSFNKIKKQKSFLAEHKKLLKTYVGRPSPLYFAKNLSGHYKTNIYLKREDLNHTGAHKINNTIGQILLAERMGKKRIIAETGAGQHGVATATVCALKGLKSVIYMGEKDMKRQSANVKLMKMIGADVIPVKTGAKTLKDATNEAIRDWINNSSDTYYIIGSVVGPHPYPQIVSYFQSVISKELKSQLMTECGRDYPDRIIACVGGGSNAAGAFYHYSNNKKVELIAVEAGGKGINSGKTAASIQNGTEGVFHGSKTIVMQTQDGQIIKPASISAGLDYPGIGPVYAFLNAKKRIKFKYINDNEALKAGYFCMKKEGIVPALESAHALAELEKTKFRKNQITVVNLSGRGDKDLKTYIKYFNDEQNR